MDTRNRIIEAAIFIFGRTPSANMTEVAKKANVSRMTVNRYFSNKDNLIRETYQYCIDCFQDAINKHKRSKVEEVTKLQFILEEYINLGNHYFFLMRNSENVYDEHETSFQDQLDVVTKIVKKAQKKGQIRKDLPDNWIACFMDFSAFAINAAVEHGYVSHENARDTLWKTLFNGIKG